MGAERTACILAFVTTVADTLPELSVPYYDTGVVEKGFDAASIAAAVPRSGIRGDNLVEDVANLPDAGGTLAVITFYLVGDDVTLTHANLQPAIATLSNPCANVVRSMYIVHKTTTTSVTVALVTAFLIPNSADDDADVDPPGLKRRRLGGSGAGAGAGADSPQETEEESTTAVAVAIATATAKPPTPVVAATAVSTTPIHRGTYSRWDAMCTAINANTKSMLAPGSHFDELLKSSDAVHDPRRRVLLTTAVAWLMAVVNDGDNSDNVARMKITTSTQGLASSPRNVCAFEMRPVNIATYVVDDLLSMKGIVDDLVAAIGKTEAKGWDLTNRLAWSVVGPVHTPGLHVTFNLDQGMGDTSFDPALM